jgi:hypothetical protein
MLAFGEIVMVFISTEQLAKLQAVQKYLHDAASAWHASAQKFQTVEMNAKALEREAFFANDAYDRLKATLDALQPQPSSSQEE